MSSLPFEIKSLPLDFQVWVRSMLPELNLHARRWPWIMGILALILGFVFSRLQFPNLSITPDAESGQVILNAHFQTRALHPPKEPVLPPAPRKISRTNKSTDVVSNDKAQSKQASISEGSKGGGPRRGDGSTHRPSRGVLLLITAMNSNVEAQIKQIQGSKIVQDMDVVMKNINGFRSTGITELRGRPGAGDDGLSGTSHGGNSPWGMGSGSGDRIGGSIGSLGKGLVAGGLGVHGVPSAALRPRSLASAPTASLVEMLDEGGGRSKSQVMNLVRARTPGLRYLFDKFNKIGGFEGGVLKLRLTLAASGEVLAVQILNSTTQSQAFDQEIKAKVSTWDFGPAPGAGTTQVTVPFSFSN